MSAAEVINEAQDDLVALLRDAPLPLIAARMKRARKEANLTHDEAGARMGMVRQQIIKLEKGANRPRLGTLLRVAEGYGRDARWFVDPEVDPSPFPDGDTNRDA